MVHEKKSEYRVTMADERDYSENIWSSSDMNAYQERRKISIALEKILTSGRELKTFCIILLLSLLAVLFFGEASAEALEKKQILQRLEVSYIAIFTIASLAFFLIRTLEFLLQKANLIKSEESAKIDAVHEWIFAEGGAKKKVRDIYTWHEPVKTDVGEIFTWKNDSRSADSVKDMQQVMHEIFRQNQDLNQKVDQIQREMQFLERSLGLSGGSDREVVFSGGDR